MKYIIFLICFMPTCKAMVPKVPIPHSVKSDEEDIFSSFEKIKIPDQDEGQAYLYDDTQKKMGCFFIDECYFCLFDPAKPSSLTMPLPEENIPMGSPSAPGIRQSSFFNQKNMEKSLIVSEQRAGFHPMDGLINSHYTLYGYQSSNLDQISFSLDHPLAVVKAFSHHHLLPHDAGVISDCHEKSLPSSQDQGQNRGSQLNQTFSLALLADELGGTNTDLISLKLSAPSPDSNAPFDPVLLDNERKKDQTPLNESYENAPTYPLIDEDHLLTDLDDGKDQPILNEDSTLPAYSRTPTMMMDGSPKVMMPSHSGFLGKVPVLPADFSSEKKDFHLKKETYILDYIGIQSLDRIENYIESHIKKILLCLFDVLDHPCITEDPLGYLPHEKKYFENIGLQKKHIYDHVSVLTESFHKGHQAWKTFYGQSQTDCPSSPAVFLFPRYSQDFFLWDEKTCAPEEKRLMPFMHDIYHQRFLSFPEIKDCFIEQQFLAALLLRETDILIFKESKTVLNMMKAPLHRGCRDETIKLLSDFFQEVSHKTEQLMVFFKNHQTVPY